VHASVVVVVLGAVSGSVYAFFGLVLGTAASPSIVGAMITDVNAINREVRTSRKTVLAGEKREASSQRATIGALGGRRRLSTSKPSLALAHSPMITHQVAMINFFLKTACYMRRKSRNE
jgi:hypothetical protein